MEHSVSYKKGFIPYALAALLIGLVGGFSTVLGPAFVQDIGIAYNNTTWTALAQAMSTAACAPILGKVGDVIGRRKTLLLGIGVYTLGNVLSALAGSLVFMMVSFFKRCKVYLRNFSDHPSRSKSQSLKRGSMIINVEAILSSTNLSMAACLLAPVAIFIRRV